MSPSRGKRGARLRRALRRLIPKPWYTEHLEWHHERALASYGRIFRLEQEVAELEQQRAALIESGVELHSAARPFFDKADKFKKVTGEEIMRLGVALHETDCFCRCPDVDELHLCTPDLERQR